MLPYTDYYGEPQDEKKFIEGIVREIIKDLSLIFLRDMWEPETLKDVKNSFVFTEEKYYEAFCDVMKKVKVNSYMSVILIDIAKQKVLEEKMIPRYDQKGSFGFAG